ncbi:Uncharacterised protein [uncultured archaeon]|nr:Uncharacterised protein [uncultured archaeon]
MRACRADAIVANDVSRKGAGFACDTNEAIVIRKNGEARELSGRKDEIAREIISLLLF